jgi:hypothetical protein
LGVVKVSKQPRCWRGAVNGFREQDDEIGQGAVAAVYL